jgi:hypothetical protein
VLTEELGHHLDALLNTTDTPGDEGELFAVLLTEAEPLSDERRQRLLADNDQGSIWLEGRELAAERASLSSTPIPAASPGRTRGEFSNIGAFAALKSDGSVVTWGGNMGGDSSAVASQLSSGVSQIFSNAYAFAALKTDGSVVAWSDPNFGGDSSGVASQLSSGVTQIYSNAVAFAALKSDGSVVTWGGSDSGGNSTAVAGQLSFGVTQIFSNGGAFAALKSNGSVVTWDDSKFGGNSSAVAGQLSSDSDQGAQPQRRRLAPIVHVRGTLAGLRRYGAGYTKPLRHAT